MSRQNEFQNHLQIQPPNDPDEFQVRANPQQQHERYSQQQPSQNLHGSQNHLHTFPPYQADLFQLKQNPQYQLPSQSDQQPPFNQIGSQMHQNPFSHERYSNLEPLQYRHGSQDHSYPQQHFNQNGFPMHQNPQSHLIYSHQQPQQFQPGSQNHSHPQQLYHPNGSSVHQNLQQQHQNYQNMQSPYYPNYSHHPTQAQLNSNQQYNNQDKLNGDQKKKYLEKINSFHIKIEEGKKAFGIGNEQEVVLVIGQNGVGKSTLVNYVSGAAMKLEIEEGEYQSEYHLMLENPSGERPKIGAGGSVTTVPNKWHDQNTGITYWDCPGFEDTNGIDQDIANAFFIKKLFEIPRVKILLLIQEYFLFERRGLSFFDLMRKINILLKGLQQYSSAFSIVVTQGRESLIEVKEAIEICIDKFGDRGPENETIGKFLYNLLKENKIALFSRITQEKDIYNDRTAIQELITKGTCYVPSNSVSITLKDSCANELRDIALVLNEHIKERINLLCKNIIEDCQQTAKKAEQTKSADLIGNIMKVLKELNKNVPLIVEECKKAGGNNFQMFLSEISKKITQNKVINLKSTDFSEIESYLNHFILFKEIDPKAAVNINLDTWLTEFQQFNTHIEKQIRFVHGIIQSNWNDDCVHVEMLMKDLTVIRNECISALIIQFSEESLNSLNEFVAKVTEVARFIEVEEKKKTLEMEGLLNHMKKVFSNLNFAPIQKALIKEKLVRDDGSPSLLLQSLKNEVKIFHSDLNGAYFNQINQSVEKAREAVTASIKDFFKKIKSYYMSKYSKSVYDSRQFIYQYENARLNLQSKSDFLKGIGVYDKNYDSAISQINICKRQSDSTKLFKNIVENFEELFQELYEITLQQLNQLHKKLVTEDTYTNFRNKVNTYLNDFKMIVLKSAHNKANAGKLVKLFQEHNPSDFEKSVTQLSNNSELKSILCDVSSLQRISQSFQSLEGENKREILTIAEWKQKIVHFIIVAQDPKKASLRMQFTLAVEIFSNDLQNKFDISISQENSSTYPKIINQFLQYVKKDLMNSDSIGKIATGFENIDQGLQIGSKGIQILILLSMKSTIISLNASDLEAYSKTYEYIVTEGKFYNNLSKIFKYIFEPKNLFANDLKTNSILSYIDSEIAFSLLIKEAECDESIQYSRRKSEIIKRTIEIAMKISNEQENNTMNEKNEYNVWIGCFIKLSDVEDFSKPTIILAQNAVYFDKDIVSNTNIAIIAPHWYIPAPRKINLSGKDGDAHAVTTAKNGEGNDSNKHGKNGSDGLPGNSGQHSGHFYGILDTHSQLKNLTLEASGGNGSNGQDAGSGSNGGSGNDATRVTRNCQQIDSQRTGRGRQKNDIHFQENGQEGGKGGDSGKPGSGGYGGEEGIVSVYCAGKKLLGSDISKDKNDLRIIRNPGKQGLQGEQGEAGRGGENGRSKSRWYSESQEEWLGEEMFISSSGKNRNGYVNSNCVPAKPLPSKNGEYDTLVAFKKEYRNKLKKISDKMISLDLTEYGMKDQFLNTINLSGNKLSAGNVDDLGYNPYFNQYSSLAMEKILELRLKEVGANKVVRVLPARFCSNQSSAISSMMITKVLESLASEDVDFAVLSYNIDMQHWVGVVFSNAIGKNGNGGIKIAYLDSEGQDMPISLFESTVSNIASLCNLSCFIVGKVVRTQSAGNCGPETIENIIEYVSGALGIKHIVYAQEDVVPHHSSLFEADLMSRVGNR